jgi:hypothetical protein
VILPVDAILSIQFLRIDPTYLRDHEANLVYFTRQKKLHWGEARDPFYLNNANITVMLSRVSKALNKLKGELHSSSSSEQMV